MDMDKVCEKVKNLLDLANNNPNENEAIAAALKAQELMAKYSIELADIKEQDHRDEELDYTYVNIPRNSGYCVSWRVRLSRVIADNFRVKTFIKGNYVVGFYGFKSDATIAKQVFSYLFTTGNKLSCKYYYQVQKSGRSTQGVMNAYLKGFVDGLEEVLAKQCVALMIVTPKKVQESWDEISKDIETITKIFRYYDDTEAYETGRREGVDIANARSIEYEA